MFTTAEQQLSMLRAASRPPRRRPRSAYEVRMAVRRRARR